MAQGPAEQGEKELKTKWPVVDGIIVETTSQIGRTTNLVFTKGSIVLSRKKVLL